jgi:hypothetical protein
MGTILIIILVIVLLGGFGGFGGYHGYSRYGGAGLGGVRPRTDRSDRAMALRRPRRRASLIRDAAAIPRLARKSCDRRKFLDGKVPTCG